MAAVVSRFDDFLARLNPTDGHEIQKTLPCLIISPDQVNSYVKTVMVAPMTTTSRNYPTTVAVTFQGTAGYIVLHQIRTLEIRRFVQKLGEIDEATSKEVLAVLARMFAPWTARNDSARQR